MIRDAVLFRMVFVKKSINDRIEIKIRMIRDVRMEFVKKVD